MGEPLIQGLHLPSIAVALGLTACLISAFTALLALLRPSYPGYPAWALGILLLSFGVLVGAERTPQTLVFAIAVGNTLLALGGALLVSSYRTFSQLGLRIERGFFAALPVYTLLILFFSVVQDRMDIRLLIVNVYCGAAMLALLWICLTQIIRQPRLRAGYVLSSAVFLTIPLTALPRLLLFEHAAYLDVTTATHSNLFLYLGILVLVTGGTFTVQLLHEDRRRLEMADLQAELHALARTDPLTGLHNRRGLEAHFLALLARHAGNLSLVVIDIDHFKSINDRYGHEIGDRCLQMLARALNENIRPGDFTARYGGEEFIVLLPRTSQAEAVEVAHRLRSRIADLFSNSVGLPPFTLSIGIAQHLHGESLEELFARADRAMYAAKQSGRNAVFTLGASGSPTSA
ncbi:diguanylate cyclase (GGDEF)-like protein [Deinobacterium chartae]|uniref:Diguanylate cyclase (GGDEF)-like protein n=1 Tax=Deinobacterium chartae TaxID=521158 RepID=A0A841I5A1_9DEIO|nr:GGDEF domain-containing protein [Deinobacterium chartae]MBB6099055.1 diguanylate cyclase (GGDEF)-like protein [Deinobacterium chartae]